MEESLGVKVADHFDLIVGTSTGGIIALGLGAGLRPREIVHFYVSHGPAIFGGNRWYRYLSWSITRKYPQEPLKKALRDCFGDKRLGDSTSRLVIPTYNLDKDEVHLFKTPHHGRLRSDWKEPLWKVALATSAAPTYFPVCTWVDRMRLVDGGVWANNPAMVGVVEAVGLLGVQLEDISVLSLGTTNPVAGKPASLDAGGYLHWRKAGIDVAVRGQSHGVQGQAQLLLGKERAIRVDPPVPDGLFALDKLSEDRLLSEAAHASRHFSPVFAEKFQPHIAAPFHQLNFTAQETAST